MVKPFLIRCKSGMPDFGRLHSSILEQNVRPLVYPTGKHGDQKTNDVHDSTFAQSGEGSEGIARGDQQPQRHRQGTALPQGNATDLWRR